MAQQSLDDILGPPQSAPTQSLEDILGTSAQGQAAGAGSAYGEALANAIPFGQRITSGMGALGAAAMGAGNVGDLYNQAQANTKATAEAHPTASTLGSLTGAVTSLPLIPSGYKFIKGAGVPEGASVISKFGNLAGQMGRSALVGAPTTAAYSAGEAPTIKDMPEAALTGAEWGAGLSAVVPPMGAVASKAGTMMGNLAKKASTPIEEHASNFWFDKVTPEQAKQVSNLKYNEAGQAGGILTPEKRDDFINAAQGARKGADGSIVPPSPLAQKILDNLEETRGQPLTLRGAQNIEQDINANISYQPNGMLTPESVQLLKIKKALRNTIDGATQNDIVGGGDGWRAWKEAKQAYSAVGILTDMNNMINKAAYSDQPGNQLRRQLSRWSLKPGASNGLNPEEMDLVKDAIHNNFSNELLRTAGSRLTSIGAAVAGLTGHGILGAVGAPAISQMGRNTAFANQLEKMAPLVEAVGERLPGNMKGFYEEHEDVPDTLFKDRGLIDPKFRIAPSEKQSYIPMTPDQIAHAQAVMNRTGNPVTTPYSGAPVSPAMQKFLPSPQTAGRLPAEGGTEAEIAHARARLAATPRVSAPYSGAPIAPQTNPAGSLTNPVGPEGYAMSIDDLYGNNPNVPDIEAYGPSKKKKAGGAVKGKIGFNLKKSKK